MRNRKNNIFGYSLMLLLMLGIFWMPAFVKADTHLFGEIKLIQTLLSDNQAFTQGLELKNDKLIMGTGKYGESAIGWLNLDTGEYEMVETLPDSFFGEGITFTNSHLWQLTWKENTAFKRDPEKFFLIEEVVYDGEGWGIAYDDEREVLWMSNGSNVLTIRDGVTFEKIDELEVTFEGTPLNYINELEFVDGELYANIWQTNQIVKINLNNGIVNKVYDFSEIIDTTEMTEAERMKLDVLNGIAHIEGNRFYITGKWYPVIYEVELID